MKQFVIGRAADCDILLENATSKTSRYHAKLRVPDIGEKPDQVELEDISSNGTFIIRKSDRQLLQKGERIFLESDDLIEFSGCKRRYSLREILVAAGDIPDPLDFRKEFTKQQRLWEEYMEFRNHEKYEKREYKLRINVLEKRVKGIFVLVALVGLSYMAFTYNTGDYGSILKEPRHLLSLVLTLPVFFTRINGWVSGWFIPKLDHQKVHDDFDRLWRCPNPSCSEKAARSEYRREGGAFKTPKELAEKRKCTKCKAVWV